MVKPQSTHSRFSFFRTKEKRDRVIDTTLDAVDTSLKLLDAASDLLPIAGVGAVVLVLRSLVKEIRVSVRSSVYSCVVTDTEIEYTHE
jgi:hypothetical protein